jgi:hypothetical protein
MTDNDIKKDLAGIKAALKFIIERKLNKELDDKLTRIVRGIHPKNCDMEILRKQVIEEHDKKYKKLLDSLK